MGAALALGLGCAAPRPVGLGVRAPGSGDVTLARTEAPIASMKAFRPLDDAFARLVYDYDGLKPPRSDVMWTDFLERLRGVAGGRLGIRQVGRAVRLDDRKEGRSLELKTPMGLAELRESLFDLVHFVRVGKGFAPIEDAGGVERVALASILCNLDAGTTLIPPAQMAALMPAGSPGRDKYQKAALYEGDPPAAVSCAPRSPVDDYALPSVGPDALVDDLYYTAVRALAPGYGAKLAANLRRVVAEAPRNLRGVILDLRGCPGGNLAEARNAADVFLAEGPAFTMYARNTPPEEYRTSTDGSESKAPLVVLIDQGCGSGCELLAATLKERGRALLVGTPTVGQVAGQMLFALPPSIGGMRLTVARFRTAQSGDIGGIGVAPDVLVADPEAPARFAAHVLERTNGASRTELIQAARALMDGGERANGGRRARGTLARR